MPPSSHHDQSYEIQQLYIARDQVAASICRLIDPAILNIQVNGYVRDLCRFANVNFDTTWQSMVIIIAFDNLCQEIGHFPRKLGVAL